MTLTSINMIPQFLKFKKVRSWRMVFLYIFLGLLYVAIMAFLFISNTKIYQKRTKLEARVNQLKQQIQDIQGKNDTLKAGISENNDENYLEKEAREKLNLKKPGEEVVVVLPPAQIQEVKVEEKKTLWEKILETLHLRK